MLALLLHLTAGDGKQAGLVTALPRVGSVPSPKGSKLMQRDEERLEVIQKILLLGSK